MAADPDLSATESESEVVQVPKNLLSRLLYPNPVCMLTSWDHETKRTNVRKGAALAVCVCVRVCVLVCVCVCVSVFEFCCLCVLGYGHFVDHSNQQQRQIHCVDERDEALGRACSENQGVW